MLTRLSRQTPNPLDDLRYEYLQLAKEIILNNVYEPGPHLDEGREWPPGHALTMIGRKRLDNLHDLALRVIRNQIPGDLIETGAWRGGATMLMRAILKAHDIRDRRVFVADSFCGIPPVNPEKYPADQAHAGTHELEILNNNSLERVQAHFERMHLLDDQVVFLKGWFKDTLPNIPTTRIALMRLDGDLYESTWDALTNLYPKLSVGGYVIIDDMCFYGCTKAVEDYRRMCGITAPIHEVDWTGVYWEKTAEIARRAA
jgi:hypothetical protein